MLKKSVVLLLFLALVPFGIYASTTGKIAGVVTDKSTGDPLPGVNVIVEGTTLGASTDIDGYYVILNVPPGFYSLKASYIGYTDMVIQEVKVSTDLTTEINLSMEPTTLELGEAIVVTAQRELIRKDETNKVEIRTAEEIQALPIRNLNSLASLTSGTVESNGLLYVRGGRSNETAYVVDGVVQNELFFGGNRTDVNPNSIEELQVQTGGFQAEYGSIMSGLVIITTQAGSPQYHFSAEGITDEFLPKDNNDFGAYSYGYQDYNFTLSGPIVPGFKKLTFFASFQRSIRGDRDPRLDWADGKTYTFVDPYNFPVFNESDSLIGLRNDTLSTTLNENSKPGNWDNTTNFNGKLRYRITNNIDVQVSGLVTIQKYQNANHGAVEGDVNAAYNRAWASGMLVNSIHNPKTELNTQSYNFTLTHTLNPTTFYTLRGGYYYTYRERGDGVFFDDLYAYGDTTQNSYLPIDPNTGAKIQAVPLNNIIAQSWMGRGYLYNNYSQQKQEMYSVNLDFTRQQGKSHLIKFGGEFRYNTVRWYSIGAYPGVVGLAAKLSAYGDIVDQYGEN